MSCRTRPWWLPLLPSVRTGHLPRQRRGRHGCGAHRGSGSGKRRVGHSGLYQPCTRLPPCRKPSCRSTGPSSSAPKPLLLLHRARRSSSSLREEEEGGAFRTRQQVIALLPKKRIMKNEKLPGCRPTAPRQYQVAFAKSPALWYTQGEVAAFPPARWKTLCKK